MRTYHFDGSLEGLLSVVFVAYRDRAFPLRLLVASAPAPTLFAESSAVPTMAAQARRVAAALEKKQGPEVLEKLARVLACMPESALTLFHYVQAVVDPDAPVPADTLIQAALDVERLDRRIGREVHRMHAFARFEQNEDGLYVATVAPEYDVLPYTISHFIERYPALRWLLVDDRRGYGLYYDGAEVQQVRAEAGEVTEEEKAYQTLWRTYFRAVNIPERQNLRLQQQHLPRRYWRYLTEKRPASGNE